MAIQKNSKLLRFLPIGTDPKEVKSCFGELPQGNESAHAKGCMECEHFCGGTSNECSNATHYKRASRAEKLKLLPPEKKEWYFGVYYHCGKKKWLPFAGVGITDSYAAIKLAANLYRIKRVMSFTAPMHHEDLLKEAK